MHEREIGSPYLEVLCKSKTLISIPNRSKVSRATAAHSALNTSTTLQAIHTTTECAGGVQLRAGCHGTSVIDIRGKMTNKNKFVCICVYHLSFLEQNLYNYYQEYKEPRLRHMHFDWSVCKFQAHDRYRKSRYSTHTSDAQYAYVQYSLSHGLLLLHIQPSNKIQRNQAYENYLSL